MAPPQARANAVREAISTMSTWSASTTIMLDELLRPEAKSASELPLAAKARCKTSQSQQLKSKPQSRSTISRTTKTVCPENEGKQLSQKEKATLATEVINNALKLLSEAVKCSAQTRRQPPSQEFTKTQTRKALRRSNSMPQSPLQPRSLNRTSSSPNVSSRSNRSSSCASISSCGQRPIAEGARLALAYLRAEASSRGVATPLQVESAMSALISKLITLGFDDLATQELRILHRRLAHKTVGKSYTSRGVNDIVLPPSIGELLDFGTVDAESGALNLIITTQIQILRLMRLESNRKHTKMALGILKISHPSSPINLIMSVANDKSQSSKAIRYLQTLSDVLLSLTPSVSTSEDILALEMKPSIAPDIAIHLQSLALRIRLTWWKLVGHQGDLSNDLLNPFLRCMSAFARRHKGNAAGAYETASCCFADFESLLKESNIVRTGLERAFACLYRTLSNLSLAAGLIETAIVWAEQARLLSYVQSFPEALRYGFIAKVAALKLRHRPNDSSIATLLLDLVEGLEGPFRSDSGDVEEMLMDVSALRRIAITLLSKPRATANLASEDLPTDIYQMCESIIFLCPRLLLRYLGKMSNVDSATKGFCRYEQRKIFIAKLGPHAIDSSFFLVKSLLADDRITWDTMDSVLQNCLALLDHLNVSNMQTSALDGGHAVSYHVKLSNLYFTQYFNMRRDVSDSKDACFLRALRRATDCLKSRTLSEKTSGLFSSKLEKLADLCKSTGRHEELLKSVLCLRDYLIEHGVLSNIDNVAISQSLREAWTHNDEARNLGRAIAAHFKAQVRKLKDVAQILLVEDAWSTEERGIVLEHQLDILLGLPTHQLSLPATAEDLRDHIFDQLMNTYSPHVHPLRRLRAQVRYLSAHQNCDPSTLDMIAKDMMRLENIEVASTKDAGLSRFSKHLGALIVSLIELHLHEQEVRNLRKSITYWCSVVREARDLADVRLSIDDLPGLIAHLQLLGDYMQVKGFSNLRVVILRLITDLVRHMDGPDTNNGLVVALIDLAEQWLKLGYTGKALSILQHAEEYCQQSPPAYGVTSRFHLSYADCLIEGGKYDQGSERFWLAQSAFTRENMSTTVPSSSQERMVRYQTIAAASRILSLLEMPSGSFQSAMTHARDAVKLLRRSWVSLEERMRKDGSSFAAAKSSPIETSQSVQQDGSTVIFNTTSEYALAGACFWPLFGPLFLSLAHLSKLYAHHGMFQETIFYAEQALKLASDVGSEAYVAEASITLGDIWCRVGQLDKASEYMKTAQKTLEHEKSSLSATLTCSFGRLHGLLGDSVAEAVAYKGVEDLLKAMGSADYINQIDQLIDPIDGLKENLGSLTLCKKRTKTPSGSKTRLQATRSAKTAIAKVSPEPRPSPAQGRADFCTLRFRLLHLQANAFMLQKSNRAAYDALQEASRCCSNYVDNPYQAIACAKQMLLHSTDLMTADPVYSVLQDSIIAFPCLEGQSTFDKSALDKSGTSRHTSTSKGQLAKSSRLRNDTRLHGTDTFLDRLCQAQDILLERYFDAISNAPVAAVHTMTALLNSVAISLFAAGASRKTSLAYPEFASCSIETARMLSLRRERDVYLADVPSNSQSSGTVWPSLTGIDSKRSSLGASSNDVSCFQQEYIDILPDSWTVISISLSENRQELSITKLRNSNSPFVLRLPLCRNNSRDADEEIFGFEQGRAELLEIIELANESAHDGRDLSTREAKIAWWETRGSLDTRLRYLLENIERVWLGGFTGMFSQHTRLTDLLARFQMSFKNVLDKHLPSRRKSKTKKSSNIPRIVLNARVLDLFVGLGDASADDCDLSEQLMDLLYFVVDILQFHGELNAYAEIDFDSMVIETYDALRCYHEAARVLEHQDQARHMILILDKTLHTFPWESLPCMEGLAVSRVPTLACLRDRILAQQFETSEAQPPGYYANVANGSYILNPGGDLRNTQTTFQEALGTLETWTGIIGREPSESEVKTILQSTDLFFYFGHGSGAQYIRAKEIRRLEQTAVSFLMGCSSGALTEVGEFEPYGTPIQYMQAGCPALVATLWDVTDKDIDKFAMNTFKTWGLFDKGVKMQQAAGKDRRKKKGQEELASSSEGWGSQISVIEAVSRSRKVCNLRYLNGAATCVYGVPVYLR